MRMRDIFLGLIGFMALMLWVMFWGPVFVVRDYLRYLQTGNWYEL